MARRAITAALVGVLSVGTVPMIALAEGVTDGVETLVATDDEFSNGTATLNFDTATDYVGTDGITTIDATDLPVYVSLSTVKVAGSNEPVNITTSNVGDYSIRLYKADEKGEPTGTPLPGMKVVEAGRYVAVVTAVDGDYEGQVFRSRFNVVGAELTGVAAYEGDNMNDNSFRFTGYSLDVNFKIGTEELIEGVDYSVEYTLGGKSVDSVTGVGTYYAKLTGMGVYAGSAATVQIPVQKFNLDNPNVHFQVDDFKGDAPTKPSRVWFEATDGTITEFNPEVLYLEPVTNIVNPDADPYKFTVKVDSSAIDNVSYSTPRTVEANKVDEFTSFTYNGAALQDTYEFDASKGEGFNAAAIMGKNGSAAAFVVDTPGLGTVTVSKIEGDNAGCTAAQAEADLASGKFGEYKVTVDAVATSDASGNVYAGSKTVTIKIWKGVINADESVYVYGPDKRVAIDSYAKAYDGSSISKSFFNVYVKGATLAPGDITTELMLGDEVVQSAVNAGEYELVITSDWYKLSGTTVVPVTIAKVDLTSLEVGAIKKWNGVAGEEYVPSSNASLSTVYDLVINLGLVYDTGNDGAAYDELGYVWNDFKGQDLIPTNVAVDLEFNDAGTWKPAASIATLGDYRVTVSVAEDVASNYVLPEGETSVTREFTVAQQGLFKDVQPSYWAYNVIQAAYNKGYMNGTVHPTWKPVYNIEGEIVRYDLDEMGVFNPEGTLTRGQVAAVLFNASGDDLDETDSNYNEHTGWVTGFDDIDGAGKGNQFYAEGVAWCKQNGVVNGYDGNFRPDDPVTREEFVSMLANYAKVVLGDDTVGTVDAGVLADYPDGSKVTDWAEANVAWAAEKGIIGNGGTLMPTDTMTRAYCAAMMVNYLNPELAK